MGESLEILITPSVNGLSLSMGLSELSDIVEDFPDSSVAKKFLEACNPIITIATLKFYLDSYTQNMKNLKSILSSVSEPERYEAMYYCTFIQQVYCFVEKVASLIGFNQKLLNKMKEYKDISKVDFNKVDVKGIYSLADNVANEIDRIVKEFSVNSIIDKLENLFNGKKEISETYSIGGRNYIVEACKDDVGIHLSVSFT